MQFQYLLLYPRAYNRRGTEDRHSIFGVTNEGVELSVKLRSQDGGTLPISVNDLAQVGLEAKCPCMASPDNGPGEHQKGLLLFTDITQETEDSVVAHSVHVVRSGVEPILPVRGIGRLSINEETRTVIAAKELLTVTHDRAERERLNGIINAPSNYQYSAIVYRVEKSSVIDVQGGWIDIALQAIKEWGSKRLLIKLFTPDMGVEHMVELEVDHPVIPIDQQWLVHLDALNIEGKENAKVLIMEFDRYECSKEASRFYAQAYPWLKELYYQGKDEALTEVILSLVESPTSDDLFLKMLFPLTKKVGMLRNLNAQGKFNFGVKETSTLPKAFKQGLNYQLKAGTDYWKRKIDRDTTPDQFSNEDVAYQKEHYHEFQYLSDEDPFADDIHDSDPNSMLTEDSYIESENQDSVSNDGSEVSSNPVDVGRESGQTADLEKNMKGLAGFIAKRIG